MIKNSSKPGDGFTESPSSRPMTLRQQLDPILKAVYGCGRNSKVKMSDPTELDVWMTVGQAKDRIEALCQEIAREAVQRYQELQQEELMNEIIKTDREARRDELLTVHSNEHEFGLGEASTRMHERIAELTQKPPQTRADMQDAEGAQSE